MKIKSDYDFRDLKNACWSGAESTIQMIEDAGYEDELMSFLEDYFGDVPTLTEVNDLLWFEEDYIKEQLGIVEWSELSDLCDSKLVKEGIKEIETFIENLDEEDSDYANDKEDAEQVLMAFEHLESEIETSVDDEEITEDLTVIISVLEGTEAWMLENKNINNMISDISSWISDHE